MIIDIVVGLVILASALISFMRGFIREVLTIAGVVGGLLTARLLGPKLAPLVRDWFGVTDGKDAKKLFDIIPMEIVADVTAYGAIFISVVIVLSILSHFCAGAAKAVGLGPVDRTLGVIFGVARALVLLGLVYLPFHLMMDEHRKEELFKGSQTRYSLEKIAASMAPLLPSSDEVKQTTDDVIKKKLQEQDLLGGKKEIVPLDKKDPKDEDKSKDGYQNDERAKLDKLFTEPAVTGQAPLASPPQPTAKPAVNQ